MKKRNKKHEQRIKKLIVGCSLCAMLLTVSTYAWFIGMKTVNISAFEVNIAAIDSLSLSLDGITWGETVSIDSESYNVKTYEGNTNSWGGTEGLVPMSSIGKIDSSTSRMILFEKGSLTTTTGGYRIMASKVNNSIDESRGYVVFDLFIRNLSGNAYYEEFNEKNEEAIYLTLDSAVTYSSTGGEKGTGIENSVRVAFAQIGRVVATTSNTTTIQKINCNFDNDNTQGGYVSAVTGICQRDAQIWEPNDTAHVQNAINWYSTSCIKRIDAELTKDSYAGDCNKIEDGKYYPTYAVSGAIDYTHAVDIYDGAEYNTWTETIATEAADGKLVKYDYFTDTEKNKKGTERPTFMTLAPNSITKVRIYIYIEGQDIDNYDFASLGKQITVNFGFTKERLFGEDLPYDDTDTATLPDDVIRGDNVTPGE